MNLEKSDSTRSNSRGKQPEKPGGKVKTSRSTDGSQNNNDAKSDPKPQNKKRDEEQSGTAPKKKQKEMK